MFCLFALSSSEKKVTVNQTAAPEHIRDGREFMLFQYRINMFAIYFLANACIQSDCKI